MPKNTSSKIKNMFIVGLGNPGEEYENTRHNTGRIIVSWLAEDLLAPPLSLDKKSRAFVSAVKVAGKKIYFILPETFMNNSGEAVFRFVKSKRDALGLIIIHDDLDLPIGRAKMSFAKHSGGHKGVESVIKKIKTEEFTRLRIGISPRTPSGKIKKPVGAKKVEETILGKFSSKEKDILSRMRKKILESITAFAKDGKDVATCIINSAF